MGITNSNKELSVSKIDCNGKFKVKLSLTATPDIENNPKDIVLVLDRSGSMQGAPLLALKESAKQFIDIIDESSDGVKNGVIGNGSHLGLVSFASLATIDSRLTTNVAQLKSSVDALSSADLTNHSDAFAEAIDVFDMSSPNEKIIVLFTDGATTTGEDASKMANLIKNEGIIIYCIGLGDASTNTKALNALKDWSTDPDSTHLILAPTPQDLDDAFNKLASNITTPGATNIIVKDTIDPCFKITSFDMPSLGTVKLIDKNNIQWNIPQLGVNKPESATFEFDVEHIGPCSGLVDVNKDIKYTDSEGNTVTFPKPKINVVCGNEVIAEDCPVAKDVTMDSCEDYLLYDAGDLKLTSVGRILDVNVKIKNVCPNRQVALGVYLTEVDIDDNEVDRGIKVMTVPAHSNPNCQDVIVKCIKFVLPEDPDFKGSGNSLCDTRCFKVRFIAHYVNTNAIFNCCNAT